MSHDACTSRTSRVVTVASLLRLKMEALIPTSADCEVRSVIKVFKRTEHIADRNSSLALPDLWALRHEQTDGESLEQTI